MLVLSRKLEDEIWIGSDISIKVVDIGKGIVKLGINAPKSIEILRGELKREVENINKNSAQTSKEQDINGLRNLFKVV